MKNLIIALSLFFVVGANAQAKKVITKQVVAKKEIVKTEVAKAPMTNEEAAKKNLTDLNAFTPLKPEMQSVMLELFTTKHRMLTESGALSAERKAIIAQTVSRKMEGTLEGSTFEKIKSNNALYQSLIN